MKKIIPLTIVLILSVVMCSAQFYKSILPSPAFSDSLNKIVKDFRSNYYNIQGDVVSEQDDVDVYQSRSSLPGALECFVYRFHSVQDTSASLQAIMYKGESYKEAARIYRNTFRLVNKTKLHLNTSGGSFNGNLEEPTENLRFASSHLKANSSDVAYKNFVAEIEMVNNYTGWEVRLNLHNKKDDRDKYIQ